MPETTRSILIPGLDDFEPLVTDAELKLRTLLYGPMGVGKTSTASSVVDHPGMRPALYINIENGQISIPGFRRSYIKRKDLISLYLQRGKSHQPVTCLEILEEYFWRIQTGHQAWASFKTVVIDSMSELQSLTEEERVTRAIERDLKLGEKAKHPNREVTDIFPQDYKAITESIKRIVRMFRDLPLNLVLVAHHKETFSRGDDAVLEAVEPTFNQKLGESIMGMMDCVFYMYSQGGNRSILMQPSGVIRAKTRPPLLADYLGEKRPVRRDQPFLAQVFSAFLELEHGVEDNAQIEAMPEGETTDEPIVPEPDVDAQAEAAAEEPTEKEDE